MSKIHIPFKYHPKTKKVCEFIRSLNPDQHYINSHQTEAIWFFDKDNWFKIRYSASKIDWHIVHIFEKDEFGDCENIKQLKKITLEKLKDVKGK